MKKISIFLIIISIIITSCSATKNISIPIVSRKKEAEKRETYDEWLNSIQNKGFRQITTHTDIDIKPSVSADGKKIAFVSRREGNTESRNLDIWIRPLNGRPSAVSVHTSADLDVTFSPKNDDMLIVSRRKDALGDIWVTRGVEKLEYDRITRYKGEDMSPDWFPDGNRIAFSSDRFLEAESDSAVSVLEKERNIWIGDVSGKNFQPLTTDGGFDPAVSPNGRFVVYTSVQSEVDNGDLWIVDVETRAKKRLTAGSAIDGFADWSPNGEKIVFSRFDRDTNNDGAVTTDDNPAIYLLNLHLPQIDSLKIANQIQLTTYQHYDYFPCFSPKGDLIYFTSDRSGNPDIWSMPIWGVIPDAPNAGFQLRYANSIRDVDQQEKSLLAYRKVIDNFPHNDLWAAEAQFEMGNIYEDAGNLEKALPEYQKVIENYPKAGIRSFVELEIAQAKFHMTGDADVIDDLYEMLERYENHRILGTKILLTIGELHLEAGEYKRALEAYHRLIDVFPNQREACAEAQVKISDIYAQTADREQVLQSYLVVLEKYFTSAKWKAIAVDRILELFVTSENVNKQLAAYHTVIEKYPYYTSIGAKAQFQIAQIFQDAGKYQIALSEYDIVLESYPNEEVLNAEAMIEQAKIYLILNDHLKASGLLESALEKYSHLRDGIADTIEKLLMQTLLYRGETMLSHRQSETAENIFVQAVSLDSTHVEAHRGLIRASDLTGRLDERITEYEGKSGKSSRDAVYRYVLGYAYAFAYDREKDVRFLNKSEHQLRRALESDYNMLYAYLTLGWVYEGLEKEGEIDNGYELAIDMYRMAISLNDDVENPQLEGNLSLNIANNYFNFVETTEFGYRDAYFYYQQKMDYDPNFESTRQEMIINERMGRCAFYIEDYENGYKYYERALTLAKKLNNIYKQYQISGRLAAFYQQAEDYPISTHYFEEGLRLIDDLSFEEMEKKERRRILYRNIAYNQFKMDEYTRAIYWAKRAENLLGKPGQIVETEKEPLKIELLGLLGIHSRFLTIPIPLPEIKIGLSKGGEFTIADEQAFTFNIIGESYFRKQDLENAIEYFLKKLDVFIGQKDELGKAIVHNNLGYLYYLIGDYAEAMYHFESSIIIARRNNLEHALLSNYLNVNTVLSLRFEKEVNGRGLYGRLPFWQGKKAMRYQKLGLELIRKLKEQQYVWRYEDKLDEIAFYNGMANIYFYLSKAKIDPTQRGGSFLKEDYSVIGYDLDVDIDLFDNYYLESVAHYKHAIDLAKRYDFPRSLTILYKNLANTYIYKKQYSKAIPYLTDAEEMAAQNGFVDILWRIKNSIAIVSRENPDTQLKYYREAIDILENMPSTIKASKEQQSYLYESLELYENMISMLMQRNEAQDGLDYMERLRSKSYVDLVSPYELELKTEMHNIIYRWGEEIKSWRYRIASLGGEITEDEWQKLQYWEERLQEATEEFEKLLERESDPKLLALFNPEPVMWNAVKLNLGEDTIMLDFSVNEEACHLWTVTMHEIKSYKIPVSRTELQELVIDYRNAIETRASMAEVNRKGRLLGNLLFSPVSDILNDYSDLVLVPDEALFYLPFSSLILNDKYVGEQFNISLVPSARDFVFAFKNRNVNTTNSLIVNGKGWSNRAIRNFGAEVETLKNRLPDPFVIDNAELIKETLHAKMEDYGFVHFSAVERANTESALSSYFVLSNAENFSVFEIFAYDLKANLLAFTNATTDLSGAGNGNDIIGLTSAAFYAGTPSVLFSLWNVESDERIEFIQTFYDSLSTDKKSAALKKSQINMMERGEHPYFWAGFTLWGFGGMTPIESETFAGSQLTHTFLAGRERKKSDPERALKLFEEAAAMAQKIDQNRLKIIYFEIVKTAYELEKYEKAGDTQVKVLEISKQTENPQEIIYSYKTIVKSYQNAGLYEKAITYQNEFIDYIRSQDGDESQLSEAFGALANLHAALGNLDVANENYQKSLELYRKNDNPKGLATTHFFIGEMNFNHSNFYEAIDAYTHSHQFFAEIGDTTSAIVTSMKIGGAYEKLAFYSQALDYFRTAWEYANQLGNRKYQVQSKQKIGDTYWRLGDYQKAFGYQREALAEARQLDDRNLLLTGHTTLGLLYLSIGDLDKALEEEKKALKYAQSESDKDQRASIYNNIGMIHRKMGDLELSLSFLQKALEIDKELDSQWGLAHSYRNTGITFILLENWEFAQEYLEKALGLSRKISDKKNEGLILLHLGNLNFNQENMEEAEAYYDSALAIARGFNLSELEWRCYRGLGNLFWSDGKEDKAYQEFARAIDIIETIRAKLKIEDYKSGFMDSKMEIYDDIITLLVELERTEEAFAYAEKAKSRNFIDMLGNQKINLKNTENEELLAKERITQDRINALNQQINILSMKEEPDTLAIESLENQLNEVRQEYVALLNKMQERNPELASLVSVQPRELSQIQEHLSEDVAILEYYVTENKLMVWIIDKNGIQVNSTDIKEKQLSDLVSRLRNGIELVASIGEQSQKLYEILIQPIRDKLTGKRTLGIVPHGDLHYLPFAALEDEDGRLLLQDFVIFYAPSASVLDYCFQKKKMRQDDERILALGNPNLLNPALDLPFSEKELLSVKRWYAQVDTFIGDAATETIAKMRAGDSELVLFSCHGEFEPETPLFSNLRLAPDNVNNGRLEVHEIFGLRLDSRLIALSACETGLGGVTAGDEVIGMVRAFIYAGSPSVVATLWRVDDLATAVTVKRFFRYLKDEPPAEALREAQLFVKDYFPHPAYWASFSLFGAYE